MKLVFFTLIKFILIFYEAPLFIAVNKENTEIVKLLLSCDKINVNISNIQKNF